MKQSLQLFGIFTAGLAFSAANADNLMQVYSQAMKSDPVFAQAESTWHSQKMNIPIAEAGYLPQVTVGANAGPGYTTSGSTIFSGASSSNSWQYSYAISASQQIFNLGVWAQIKGADASVKAATASYLAAQQSLMQRTAQAYFNVLQAYDQLRYTVANKRAVWRQLLTAREQFRVGLIAITDEYDAQANYDQVVAQQITAQNNLNTQIEALRKLTGRNYSSLNRLGKKLPLIRPQPNNIDTWVDVADKQNYSLQAQNYNLQAAMEAIKQKAAGGYPSLNLQGAYTGGNSTQSLNSGNVGGISTSADFTSANIGLSLAYQPIQGGLVVASKRQARYNYTTAAGMLEQTHRSVVYQTRSSFLSVLSNSSQIKADKQTIISSRNALAATEAGLRVGTRTMVDVLSAMTTLYQAQEQYANDQYAYINNLISLKAAAGTLSVTDLEVINSWLGKSITFPDQINASIMPTINDNSKLKMDDVVQPEKIAQNAASKIVSVNQDSPIVNNRMANSAITKNTPPAMYSIGNSAPVNTVKSALATSSIVQLAPPATTQLPQPGST
ncbi:MAG: TolC family outer membrane protein [Gammaproteobacteria bacterium]|nr:TolC family outer membrane protein [Gammaproteobacteria bacterium]